MNECDKVPPRADSSSCLDERHNDQHHVLLLLIAATTKPERNCSLGIDVIRC
jgi:hypothetical protein